MCSSTNADVLRETEFERQIHLVHLVETGVLSKRTALEMSGLVKDVDEEMLRLAQER